MFLQIKKSTLIILLLVAIVVGGLWNLLIGQIMGANFTESLRASWLIAGAFAGVVAVLQTITSMVRNGGEESFLAGLCTYYLAMVGYWFSFVVVERTLLCWQARSWTSFDLYDHMLMIVHFFTFGTFVYGIFLIPLCFLTRAIIWRIYCKFEA